ncbi:hypothetical protein [Cryptosporangium sp. NPDC048952]|uniref:hypothetical protein n=1 Tax=Cryptosporangium sp. NPDC048952 TaxID=3363961 RepID=UPI003714C8FC
MAALVLGGCASARSPHGSPAGPAASPSASTPTTQAIVEPVGSAVDVAVSPKSRFDAAIPDVVRITAPQGTFSGGGTVTIRRQKVKFAANSGLIAAGDGIDVVFDDTSLHKPLTLTFTAGPRPSPEAIPVIAHQSDAGFWDYRPATVDAHGNFTLTTTDFSINIPTWANPLAWWRSFKSALASAVGGRTSPITCSGPPSWFHLDAAHSGLVHACAKTNTYKGAAVAEIQIKSNRGVSLQVDVPGTPSYVWVSNMTWEQRQALGSKYDFNPNWKVLLQPGEWMTVGYKRTTISSPYSFYVSGATALAAGDTFARQMIGMVLGGGTENIARVLVAEGNCIGDLGADLGGSHVGVNSVFGFLDCWRQVLNEEIVGGGLSKLGVKQAKLLAARVAMLITLWPIYQLGFGNVFDEIHGLLTNGESQRVNYRNDPAPVAPPPVDPAPVNPAPAGPVPVNPVPVDPAPADPAPADSASQTYAETVGGPTHTWSNHVNGGGTEGPLIAAYQTVQITCWLPGLAVANGNTNWYRIASPGWNDTFYASADAFYNNGSTSGTLKGTPWVDPAVPRCA